MKGVLWSTQALWTSIINYLEKEVLEEVNCGIYNAEKSDQETTVWDWNYRADAETQGTLWEN